MPVAMTHVYRSKGLWYRVVNRMENLSLLYRFDLVNGQATFGNQVVKLRLSRSAVLHLVFVQLDPTFSVSLKEGVRLLVVVIV